MKKGANITNLREFRQIFPNAVGGEDDNVIKTFFTTHIGISNEMNRPTLYSNTDTPEVKQTNESGSSLSLPDAPIRVLVVDDEESIRSLVSLVLEEDGYAVSSAASGEEALKLFEKNPYPIVITDIRMGEMDGITLLKNVLELDTTAQVIIITSHVSSYSSIQALKKGAFDYLVKPFEDLDEISTVVNRAIEKSKSQAKSIERQKQLTKRTAQIIKNNNEIIKRTENIAVLTKKIRESVNKDNLTGLPAENVFNAMIAEEIDRAPMKGGNAILMLVRVNGLQKYTKQFGTIMANTIIIGISKLVTFRHSDSATRYNANTFAVLIRNLKIDSAKVYAQKVCERIAGIKKLHLINISVNIGVAGYPDDATDAEKLTQLTNSALSKAKLLGPNRSLHPSKNIMVNHS